MRFQDVKTKLINLFEYDKLDGRLGAEWGFNNETDRDVKKIGYSTNLTPETIREAIRQNVDLIVTHHDAWALTHLNYTNRHKPSKINTFIGGG